MVEVKFCLILFVISFASSLNITRYYKEEWFTVPLDHFSFARNETFQLRYLINDSFWDNKNGPIFFYTGNERSIEFFAKHTGFVWDIAPKFKALVVFAEHRYYGKSMPFGNKSLEPDNLGYLSSSQALGDYAHLVNMLTGDSVKPRNPVIAFGGSYGGMLAAYFRMKYPHLVAGAIAASAPMQIFSGMKRCEAFADITTFNYRAGNGNCEVNIRNSWVTLRNKAKTEDGRKFITDEWNLCDPVTNTTNGSDVDALVAFLKNMYYTIAMVNYPFESDFVSPLPANPVRYICQFLKGKLEGDDLLKAIGKSINTFTNYTGDSKCVNFKNTATDKAWDYQVCTEIVIERCSTGKYDMFEPELWDEKKDADDCRAKFKVEPDKRLARIEYGGPRLNAASNIVFSNGLLDPGLSGGILSSPNESIKIVIILNAAHHLDLMGATPNDSFYVVDARLKHKAAIKQWIEQFQNTNT